MNYYLLFKSSATNMPMVGLVLSWVFLTKADGTAYTPQPPFAEIGNGFYTFTLAPTQDLVGRVDGGSLLAVQDRYADVALSPIDVVATQSSVNAIPTTPLLAGNYTAPPMASEIAASVWSAGGRTLSSFGTLVSDIAAAVWVAGVRTLTAFTFTPAVDKTGYTLAPSQRVKLDAAQPDYAPAKSSDVSVTVNAPAVTVNPTLTSAEHNQLMAIPITAPDMTAIEAAIISAMPVAPDNAGIATLEARLTSGRAALIDNLAVPAIAPGPVIVVPTPPTANLQTLWGQVKDLGAEWAVGDIVRVTPKPKQVIGGVIIDNDAKETAVDANGFFSLPVDKTAQVRVEICDYFNKSITVTDDDEKNLGTY